MSDFYFGSWVTLLSLPADEQLRINKSLNGYKWSYGAQSTETVGEFIIMYLYSKPRTYDVTKAYYTDQFFSVDISKD